MRSFVKYTGIGFFVALLIVAVVIAVFLFRNEAPITSGNVQYGIIYKNDLRLDLYGPTKKVFDTSPVVVFIHGGAWIGGTKAALNFNRINGAVNTLRENGYTIISPNYSLAGKDKNVFPDCILDMYDAIEWTKKNASLYELDTTNIGFVGESAGAHIAMMIAFSDTTLNPEKYKKTKFNYVVDLYGPNDLTDIYHSNTVNILNASADRVSKLIGTELNWQEHVFGFDPSSDTVRADDLLYKFSPVNNLNDNGFPVLILHGKNDRVCPSNNP
jgi:acetyl esterase/lipase